MRLTEEMIKELNEVWEKGDNQEIKKLLKIKSNSHVSLILSGKTDTTVSNVAKIKVFISTRKKQIAQITNDNN